ncbi:MAG TPA: aldehyde reductase [Pyrinomonadaceae bacterium]|jgi:nucleoside-diphosphate-sugar epimerase|nr:aldehyde reductase [Pyrinomonadaceae bacterium]
MANELVLVTGGSGFIGAHCILQLLEKGYSVRTTVRQLSKEPHVRAMLKEGGADAGESLSFIAADLMSDEGWAEAVRGCDHVLHVASPFPLGVPKHEDEIIRPAREGALRVLKAARDAGVKRVVLTSSFAAVGYGQPITDKPFNETNWTDPKADKITAYVKSKTLAERAAWNFIENEGNGMELSVVNPVGVFGPVLGADFSTSIELVKRLMDGAMPGCPRLTFGVVDVRDVADLHLRAMNYEGGKGERFLAVSGDFMSIKEIAGLLRERMPDAARRVPTRMLPDWVLRLVALFDGSVRQLIPELGKLKNGTNEKAKRVLGWEPRSREDAILATAESLVKYGLLKK